ncbi:MAG: hypothetical protein JRF25_00285 [Deltaproteobacteria bacterium]|nr:hypothetical protein [Deltaproteobacteria bacterium]
MAKTGGKAMNHVTQGRNLIMLEAESVGDLLYMVEFLIKQCPPKGKELFKRLQAQPGNGFTVWQELKDNTREILYGD